MQRLIEALNDDDDGWKEWIKIEGKRGLPEFKKKIEDWLAAPIEWEEDMPDTATARGSAKRYFERCNDAEREALGVSIGEFSNELARVTWTAAVLEKDIEEANEAAQKRGLHLRFRRAH